MHNSSLMDTVMYKGVFAIDTCRFWMWVDLNTVHHYEAQKDADVKQQCMHIFSEILTWRPSNMEELVIHIAISLYRGRSALHSTLSITFKSVLWAVHPLFAGQISLDNKAAYGQFPLGTVNCITCLSLPLCEIAVTNFPMQIFLVWQ